MQEVPFERKAPAGFFSTAKEGDEAEGTTAFKKISLEGLEGKRRDKEEEEERRRDKQKQKRKQEKNMPQAVMEINKLNDAEQATPVSILLTFVCDLLSPRSASAPSWCSVHHK